MNLTFRLCVKIPSDRSREAAFAWIWNHLEEFGLLGIHEGSVVPDSDASWTLDSAEAPPDRDWVGAKGAASAELYFSSEPGAKEAIRLLKEAGMESGPLEKQEPQDWDAEWKAGFLGGEDGVPIPPFWRVVPPWLPKDHKSLNQPGEFSLKINPGAGFGTGTHETTQLCLRGIGEIAARLGGGGRPTLAGLRVLDFGSGSGILSIAAARLGAQAFGIEVDHLALDNARENAALNHAEDGCTFGDSLTAAPGPFKIVLANILRPVLLQFRDELLALLDRKGGTLILSGLIESDVEEVSARYEQELKRKPLVLELGEWRSLTWKLP